MTCPYEHGWPSPDEDWYKMTKADSDRFRQGFLYREPGKEYNLEERIEMLEKEVLDIRKWRWNTMQRVVHRLKRLEEKA